MRREAHQTRATNQTTSLRHPWLRRRPSTRLPLLPEARRAEAMGQLLGTRCHDCRMDIMPMRPGYVAEWYMVRDEVWQDAINAGVLPGFDPPDIRYLCVGCLEGRLCRRLVAADFTDVPVNSTARRHRRFAWWWRTPRLQSRLADSEVDVGGRFGALNRT